MDLLNQYEQLMGNGIGFEHYFLNYYLYLPFTKQQEEITIFESAKYLLDLNLITIKNLKNNNNIDFFFKELNEILSNMKNYSKCEVDEIKNKLLEANENKRKIYQEEISLLALKLNNFIINKSKEKDLNIINAESEKDRLIVNDKNHLNEIAKKIIYGDYVNKNESVEVYLHQRTMKKVKYKKRDFSEVHQIDLDKLDKIKNKLKEVYAKENNDGIFLILNYSCLIFF